MFTKSQYILTLLLIFIHTGISGQNKGTPMQDVQAFKAKLETMTDKVNAIESDFIQEKNLSILASKIVSKGHFIYKKDNNIRWEYNQPYRYLIIISNNKIFIKEDQSQKQYDIQSNKMFQEMNNFISGCIQGDILKNEKDYTTGYFEDEKNYFVSLIPRQQAMHKMLNEVQIWFNKDDLTVSRISMIEAGGDYTKIDFINKKLNTEISGDKFTFK